MRLTALAPIAAALIATAALTACSKPADAPADSATAPPAATGPTDAEAQAMLASLPAPYNAADLINGKKQFARCRSCHTVGDGQADLTGPNLYGFFNRPMASRPGYNYSDAMKAAGHHPWDAQHLDAWIENPRAAHPGTKMAFAGLKDETDRRDLIAWLMTQTNYKPS